MRGLIRPQTLQNQSSALRKPPIIGWDTLACREADRDSFETVITVTKLFHNLNEATKETLEQGVADIKSEEEKHGMSSRYPQRV